MAQRLKSGHILRIHLCHGWGYVPQGARPKRQRRLPRLLKIFDYRSLLPLLPEDRDLPEMRVSEGTIADRMVIFQLPRPGATLYTKNLALRPQFETVRANVVHLEFLGARGSGLIELSTTMAFIQQEGVRIDEYFGLTAPRDTYEYELLKGWCWPIA